MEPTNTTKPARPLRLVVDETAPLPEPEPRRVTGEQAHARFLEMLAAAGRTIDLLEEHGMPVQDLDGGAEEVALALAQSYAKDPEMTAKKAVTLQKSTPLPPPALREAHRILSTFGQSVVQDSMQIRHMVTNKLIEESENPDPKVRLKALELLGKISDVGLFAEKVEKTITHQTSDDLKERLREKLTRLISEEGVVDAEIVETHMEPPDEEQPDYNEVEVFMDVQDVEL